jgi:hypothetical protein
VYALLALQLGRQLDALRLSRRADGSVAGWPRRKCKPDVARRGQRRSTASSAKTREASSAVIPGTWAMVWSCR